MLIGSSIFGFLVFKIEFLFSRFHTGGIYRPSLFLRLLKGIYGEKKGTPKEL